MSLLHAHLVFPKYRRPVFTDAMLTFTETTMRDGCAELDVESVEFNGETDHVHLVIAYPPTLAISVLVQRLKGRNTYPVRREFTGACVRARIRGHLWSPSHFAVSCGGAPLSIIKQHIDGQTRPFNRRASPGHTRDGLTPPQMARLAPKNSVNVGGRERTRADFEKLCSDSGFRLTTVKPLPPPAAFSLVEAEPMS